MASICVKEFALRRDAQHYAHLIDVDRGAGSYIDPRLGRITVAEWFERWWPTVTTLRPSTRGIRRHVLPSTTTGTSSPNTYPDMMQKTGRFSPHVNGRIVSPTPHTVSRASTHGSLRCLHLNRQCVTHTALDYPADQASVKLGNTLSATFS